jgi:hypothetical protein
MRKLAETGVVRRNDGLAVYRMTEAQGTFTGVGSQMATCAGDEKGIFTFASGVLSGLAGETYSSKFRCTQGRAFEVDTAYDEGR